MPGHSSGLHSAKLGIKKRGSAVKDLLTDLFVSTITLDPPSLTTMTGAVPSGITVTGALLGDRVELFPPYDMQGIIAFGYVSAQDTVKISLFNPTGGTIDLASGSWTIHVIRK